MTAPEFFRACFFGPGALDDLRRAAVGAFNLWASYVVFVAVAWLCGAFEGVPLETVVEHGHLGFGLWAQLAVAAWGVRIAFGGKW